MAKDYVDDYEITPEYSYKFNAKNEQIKIIEKSWVIKDDRGKLVCSLLAPPVVLALIRQLVKILGLEK